MIEVVMAGSLACIKVSILRTTLRLAMPLMACSDGIPVRT